MTPGKFGNVLGWAFFHLLILPAHKSILACLASDHSASGTWHIGGLALEVPEDVVGFVVEAISVELPDDYVVAAARSDQSVVRTEGQSIDTLFRMRVVQLVDALAFFPAVNPDIPIVAS